MQQVKIECFCQHKAMTLVSLQPSNEHLRFFYGPKTLLSQGELLNNSPAINVCTCWFSINERVCIYTIYVSVEICKVQK